MAEINVGGNTFFTNLREARKEAARCATATIYKFSGSVMDAETISIDSDDEQYARPQSLYLTMWLGEGCSDASWDLVQVALQGEIVANREDWRWN